VPAFVDSTAASTIAFVSAYTLGSWDQRAAEVAASTVGGAAAGDCDSDGDIDLFITYGDQGPNRLYLNRRSHGSPLLFQDSAASAGVAGTRPDGRNDRHSGPIFADMDGDFDLDLFIGGVFGDPVKIYRNRGDCSFQDVTSGSGLEDLVTPQTFSASFGDYDLDGKIDLFLTHWGSRIHYPETGQSEHLYRNVSDANGIRFENVSAASKITGYVYAASEGEFDISYTATFARLNDDLWPDIALASDFGKAQLFLADPSAPGTFIDATNEGVRSVQFGMGSAVGDIDFDGDLDWFVTSIYGVGGAAPYAKGNRLLRNPGGNLLQAGFEDITDAAGVDDGMWGWAACFLDIDNDTDLDIYHTNGWPFEFHTARYESDRSRAFVSNGKSGFVNLASTLGLDDSQDGRGVVCADLDNDGDTDILQLTKNSSNSATLWANTGAAAGRNFLRVRLVGLPPNTEAAGARIFVTIGAQTQMREIMIGNNYTSQNPTVQVFGLGASAQVDELRVEWPPLAPGPTQPAPTVRGLVRASLANSTLVICHPGLVPAPASCN
jgi:hypothetical protein